MGEYLCVAVARAWAKASRPPSSTLLWRREISISRRQRLFGKRRSMVGSILRKPGNCGLVGSRKHFLFVMAFTEHMTGLAITWQVYMSANEITALQTSIRKRHEGGTFDILDDHLKGEWHLSRDRFLLRYQTCKV